MNFIQSAHCVAGYPAVTSDRSNSAERWRLAEALAAFVHIKRPARKQLLWPATAGAAVTLANVARRRPIALRFRPLAPLSPAAALRFARTALRNMQEHSPSPACKKARA